MKPYEIHLGDCLDVLRTMPNSSVEAIVTDPPYGLSFMGKHWDYDVPSVKIWAECLRVLKPGGHLLAFAGTRTQHRMACRIEDAGFEIRDMIAWVYGCLDEQTQLVTPDGPQPYHRAKAGDPVLCYNVETKEYSYQPIQDVVIYDYSDTAYRLVGDHGEQVVSRNHRCLVERSGSEVFQLAETLEQQACVPVLEDLPALQQTLRDAHQGASGQEQGLRQAMCGGFDRQSQQWPHASGASQAQPSGVLRLRRRSAQARFMVEARRCSDLQQAVQREAQGPGMEAARQQGSSQLAARVGASFDQAHDWRHQSGMERRADLSQSKGGLRQSIDPLPALSRGVVGHGSKGWLRDGVPPAGGSSNRQAVDQNGSGASRQPRCNGQPTGEPNAVCQQWATQGIRTWSGHRAAVVRIEPFHYTGKVWCLKVPTSCFVAWRDGMAFPTGNSGFPKSLDVSKAIDKGEGHWRGKAGAVTSDNGAMSGGNYERTPKGEPVTPPAQQWQGWGTSLKPSIETVTCARKPLETVGYCATMLKSLRRIEAQCLQHVNGVARSSRPSQAASPEERIGSALGPAATPPEDGLESKTATGEAGATGSLVDTLESTSAAANIALSIASSWRRTLEGVCAKEKTSTTATELKTTTDWKTLSCCLLQITPESIIQACSLPGGFDANASTAARIFNASLALLQSTLTLSAIEPVTWQELDACQGEGVQPSLDPCVMARKPFSGTVAANVLEHGTGALNVDSCRITQEGQSCDADAYRRLFSLGSASYIRGLSVLQLRGSLLYIASVLRSCSTDGTAPLHNAHDLGDSLLDRVLCEHLLARLFPNGAWCGGSSWSAPDSLIGCRSCRRSCDEHTLLLREAAQCGAASLADALERMCSEQPEPEHSRESQCSDHLSSLGDCLLAWSLSFLAGEYCTLYSPPPQSQGRWPANLIHDGSEEVLAGFPKSNDDSAARFFYCSKASKRDRDEGLEGFPFGNNMRVNGQRESEEAKHATLRANIHPTVKPTDLMRYLCRLVTPPGGTVLDPFMGSGSTGKAAILEGFQFIGIEREAEYVEIAKARIASAQENPKQEDLF